MSNLISVIAFIFFFLQVSACAFDLGGSEPSNSADVLESNDTHTASADTLTDDVFVADSSETMINDTFVPADIMVEADTIVLTDTYTTSADTQVVEDTFVPVDTSVATDTRVEEDTYQPVDTYVVPTDTYQPPQDTYAPSSDTYVAMDTQVVEDTFVPADTTVVPVNHCNPNPCLNGGICTNKVNGFTCNCGEYFTGTTCGTQAVDCLSNVQCDDWDYTTVDYCTNEKVCSSELWGITFKFSLPVGVTSEATIHVYNSSAEWDKKLSFNETHIFTYDDLCVWGVKVAVENLNHTWWGCESGTSSKHSLIILMDGEVYPVVDYFFQTEPGACAGGGEGNLLFTKEMLGCPTQTNPASVY